MSSLASFAAMGSSVVANSQPSHPERRFALLRAERTWAFFSDGPDFFCRSFPLERALRKVPRGFPDCGSHPVPLHARHPLPAHPSHTSRHTRPRPGREDRIASLILAAREYSTSAVMFHNEVAEHFGLSVTDLKTLDILQRRGPLTAGEIAEHTRLATGSVTSLLDRLETKRFIRRCRDADDRRRVVVKLTPKLEHEIAPLFQPLQRRMRAHFATYSAEETEIIRSFLLQAAGDMREEAKREG